MNTKQFIKFFLLIAVLLCCVVRAEEVAASDEKEEVAAPAEEVEDDEVAEKPEEKPVDEPVVKPTVAPTKTTTVPAADTHVPVKTTPAKKPVQTTTKVEPTKAPTANKPVKNTVVANKTQAPAPVAPAKTSTKVAATNVASNPTVNKTVAANKTITNSATPATGNENQVAPVVDTGANTGAGVPNTLPNTGNSVNTAGQNVSTVNTADGNVEAVNEEGSSGGAVKGTVIGIVAVCAVAGIATAGVRAYNKKNEDGTGIVNDVNILSDMEAGKSDDNMSGSGVEAYNPYNIMSNLPAQEPYQGGAYDYDYAQKQEPIDSQVANTTYDNLTTTPFEKSNLNVNTSYNAIARDSIFSNNGNPSIPQIGNDIFNFDDSLSHQLPYVQEGQNQVEDEYFDEPVSTSVQKENSYTNNQMPTLVPVQPEIVITPSQDEEEEQTQEPPEQEGYKQIVPTVAQMEIIETPDFNNMTPSMIEDHINNMELEQLANTETAGENQTNEAEDDGGYKQIVPDIQEAVIETFPDYEDDEEDMDTSVVDNITDTYRAALRATYCSVTSEDNRLSYRTVDSDHSLLHNMREDGAW